MLINFWNATCIWRNSDFYPKFTFSLGFPDMGEHRYRFILTCTVPSSNNLNYKQCKSAFCIELQFSASYSIKQCALPVITKRWHFCTWAQDVYIYFFFVSHRTQDPPNLPDGVAHKLAANYYYSRDLRRAAAPPTVGYTPQNLLESG